MNDDFEYFSLIGRGGSCTPDTRLTPERETTQVTPSQQRKAMSVRRKKPVHRVGSDGKSGKECADTEPEGMRPRTNSMPSKNHLLRVRNFQTSGKRLENRGDTMKSSSHCSLVSGSSDSSEGHSDTEAEGQAAASQSQSSSTHRILLLGGEGVGKTTLTQQFLTSDDITGADYLGKH